MKKLLFILFFIAAFSSCKKEAGDCYKCIPAASQPYSGDTIICEGHVWFDKAANGMLSDDNFNEVKCKKMN